MSQAILVKRPARIRFPSGYIALDRRWSYLTGACALWAVAFWQLAGPVSAFLTEAARVRMQLPSHIHWANGLPWWTVAVVGTLAALVVGARFRRVGHAVLVGLPLLANAVIHLSLHAAQSTAAYGLMLYH